MTTRTRVLEAPRRIPINQAAWLIYDWFNGAEWPADRPTFSPSKDVSVRFTAAGDQLLIGSEVVARRGQVPYVAPQSQIPQSQPAVHSHARALCRVVVGGYHA